MEYMFRKRDEVSRIIQKNTHTFPEKLQENVEMMLQTPLEEEIGKVSKLVIFLCCGSEWQLLSIVKVTLKLTGCVAVRVSSYIPFPERHPLIRDSKLLKIHNGSNNNCFLYS